MVKKALKMGKSKELYPKKEHSNAENALYYTAFVQYAHKNSGHTNAVW